MRVAHLLSLVSLPWSTSSKKEGGPIGQPRRENPVLTITASQQFIIASW